MKPTQVCSTSLDCFVKEQINNVSFETAITLVIILALILILNRGLRLFKR